jgi:hypothetical protein
MQISLSKSPPFYIITSSYYNNSLTSPCDGAIYDQHNLPLHVSLGPKARMKLHRHSINPGSYHMGMAIDWVQQLI